MGAEAGRRKPSNKRPPSLSLSLPMGGAPHRLSNQGSLKNRARVGKRATARRPPQSVSADRSIDEEHVGIDPGPGPGVGVGVASVGTPSAPQENTQKEARDAGEKEHTTADDERVVVIDETGGAFGFIRRRTKQSLRFHSIRSISTSPHARIPIEAMLECARNRNKNGAPRPVVASSAFLPGSTIDRSLKVFFGEPAAAQQPNHDASDAWRAIGNRGHTIHPC